MVTATWSEKHTRMEGHLTWDADSQDVLIQITSVRVSDAVSLPARKSVTSELFEETSAIPFGAGEMLPRSGSRTNVEVFHVNHNKEEAR